MPGRLANVKVRKASKSKRRSDLRQAVARAVPTERILPALMVVGWPGTK